MTRKQKSKGISKGTSNAILIGGGLLGIYLITRPGKATEGGGPTINILGGEKGEPGTSGQSILQRSVEYITTSGGQAAYQIGTVPGAIAIGIPKKALLESERITSEEVFGGETKKGVSTFLATAPPGSTFGPVTYQQFIEQQPLAFRGAADVGNILTAQTAAQYGKYAAEETKKGQIIAGRSEGEYAARFAQLPAWQQALVGLGQAVTVPFGGGGASGWGARATTPGGKETIKKVATAPFAGLWGLFGPSYS